jgi:hypothetical protein
MVETALLAPQATSPAGSADPIKPVSSAVTAFIGRTVRGPLHEPVQVRSFADFQRHFGGLWQPSTLSYALEHYFEHGGQTALVVRIDNGARAPTLTLAAGALPLVLRAVQPGTREFLRASVDYDGISAAETDRFNLVLQRVRTAGTEQVDEQESHRRISIRDDAVRSVVEALAASRLARLAGPLPCVRPHRTSGGNGAAVGYVDSSNDGDDGDTPTDYDIIGSAEMRSGLFALQDSPLHFGLLCIPPLGRDRDVGHAALTVATRLCRARQSMLVIDPPAEWSSPEAALAALRGWPLQSVDACMYFPRLSSFDRLRGRQEVFGSSGAAAGLLASVGAETARLRPSMQPAARLSRVARQRLSSLGVNTFQIDGEPEPPPACTLLPETASRPAARHLTSRRLALGVCASILRGTRWALMAGEGPTLWNRLSAQVQEYLATLAGQGTLVPDLLEDSYFVVCDDRVNKAGSGGRAEVRILFGYADRRPGDFQTFLVTHRIDGSQVRAASVNRLLTGPRRAAPAAGDAMLHNPLF